MRAGTIIVTHPNGFERELALGAGALRVGSAPGCDLVLAGIGIAPHHATIACDEQGRLVIEICGENILGQGGMRLTFNLSQIARRRDLAWFGDYVVSYQPATWQRQTQPLSPADLPLEERAVGQAPATQRSADETSLLRALLGQGLAGSSHEAATLAMPLMALAACDA
jgi:hypothetical protein